MSIRICIVRCLPIERFRESCLFPGSNERNGCKVKTERELLDYACEKFEDGDYSTALEIFISLYEKKYEREWLLENIYNCYMSGNEETFRQTFREQAKDTVSYEECILDFIPFRDGEYFIFDKNLCVFKGLFSVSELQSAEPEDALKNIEFSAVALVIDWDFRNAQKILSTAKERKIYMISRDIRRCMSFWKIPELSEYLKNVKVFPDFEALQAYFHQNTAVYLPRIFVGKKEDQEELKRIRKEEHEYRLTPEGRNTSNVLLTIAIPTANRGNQLLKRMENLLQMPYDAEVEIAVSKNCNKFYEEEYTKVSNIKDARLNYYDHGKELWNILNWHYAAEMSCGEYVMLTSDEDDLFIEALEHYFKLLSTHPELSLVRPKSVDMYNGLTERKYGKKGWEAFELVFLTQYHFPGMIVRRKVFMEADLLRYECYRDTNYYYTFYPHDWWCSILSQKGDCVLEPILLYDDSQPINVQEENKALGYKDDFVPGWKSYESRIKQFQGIIEFLQSVIKVEDTERFEQYLNRAVGKTALLIKITRSTGFEPDNYENMIDQFAKVVVETIEKSCLNDGQKERELAYLANCCMELFQYDGNPEILVDVV